MGLAGSKSARDAAASVSPWNTQVRVHNQLSTPVSVWLCRDAEAPSSEDAIKHEVPAYTESGIFSGWLREPKATLLIRTGVDAATVVRMPHATRLVMRPAACGLMVESTDEAVSFEDFADPGAVPGHDTVPMRMRGESFSDRAPVPRAAQESTARDTAIVPKQDAKEVGIDSEFKTPLLEGMCQDADAPSATEGVQHEIPAEGVHGINSDGLAELSATRLTDTGIDEAEVVDFQHATDLAGKAAPYASKLESTVDAVVFKDFADAGSVPDGTVPKQVLQESLADDTLAKAGA